MPVTSIINNVSEIYRDKLKSPFVGAFIFWWFVFHRVELYDLFFNSKVDETCERCIIDNMFLSWDSICYLAGVVGASILSVIFYYFIQWGMYRYIIYRYENIAKPNALKLNKGQVVDMEIHNALWSDFKNIEKRLEETEADKNRISKKLEVKKEEFDKIIEDDRMKNKQLQERYREDIEIWRNQINEERRKYGRLDDEFKKLRENSDEIIYYILLNGLINDGYDVGIKKIDGYNDKYYEVSRLIEALKNSKTPGIILESEIESLDIVGKYVGILTAKIVDNEDDNYYTYDNEKINKLFNVLNKYFKP